MAARGALAPDFQGTISNDIDLGFNQITKPLHCTIVAVMAENRRARMMARVSAHLIATRLPVPESAILLIQLSLVPLSDL